MDFKYDIAFSFTTDDEAVATQINDLIQDRYRTFLYSKAQDQLAGTDGELTFNSVFGKEARTVAVLLRPEWGHTPWTRIEETAIRNRAYSEGYDFTTFIVTAPKTQVPEWVPKTRLWYNLPRFGIKGAASLLEARIEERGGAAVEETIADRAARLQRAQKLAQDKQAFARSYEGVNASIEAYAQLIRDLKNNSGLLASIGCRLQDVQGEITMLVGRRTVMTLEYERRYLEQDLRRVREASPAHHRYRSRAGSQRCARRVAKAARALEMTGPTMAISSAQPSASIVIPWPILCRARKTSCGRSIRQPPCQSTNVMAMPCRRSIPWHLINSIRPPLRSRPPPRQLAPPGRQQSQLQ